MDNFTRFRDAEFRGRYDGRHYLVENATISNVTLSNLSYYQDESGTPLIFSHCRFENVTIIDCHLLGVGFENCVFVNSSIENSNLNMPNVSGHDNIIHADHLSFMYMKLQNSKVQFLDASNQTSMPFQWLQFHYAAFIACEFPNILKDVLIEGGEIQKSRIKSLHSSKIVKSLIEHSEIEAVEFSGVIDAHWEK